MTFTPVHTLLGGYLLHLASSSILEDNGRVFGISGILSGAIFGPREGWRWAVVGGLMAGPLLGFVTGAEAYFPGNGLESITQVGIGRLIIAGGLVGLGSRLGSGCTSGHMLCGVSRLSPRSLIATITFFTTAVITANLAPAPYSSPIFKPPAATATAFATHPASYNPSTLIALFSTVAIAKLAQQALRRYLLSARSSTQAARATPYFLNGVIFSLGLSFSGMADPRKVLGFLRFPQARTNLQEFDPSLAMVMLGGLLPNMIHYVRLTRDKRDAQNNRDGAGTDVKRDAAASDSSSSKRLRPKYPWELWRVPSGSASIDWKLIVGSAIFGIGWGCLGICPGPALVNLGEAISRGMLHFHATDAGEAQRQMVVRIGAFIGSMLLGMAAIEWSG